MTKLYPDVHRRGNVIELVSLSVWLCLWAG